MHSLTVPVIQSLLLLLFITMCLLYLWASITFTAHTHSPPVIHKVLYWDVWRLSIYSQLGSLLRCHIVCYIDHWLALQQVSWCVSRVSDSGILQVRQCHCTWDRLTGGIGGRRAYGEGQGLQSRACYKCNAKRKSHIVRFWLVAFNFAIMFFIFCKN